MVEYEFVREYVTPPRINESPEMIAVRQHTWGVTNGYRDNTILKTRGLINCIGVTAYDPKTKTAGLLHMDGGSGYRYTEPWMGPFSDIWMMTKAMQRNGAEIGKNNALEAHIVWNPNVSANLVQVTSGVLINEFNIQKVIVFPGDTTVIDARDGQLYRLSNYEDFDRFDKRYSKIIKMNMRSPALKTVDDRSLGITSFPYL